MQPPPHWECSGRAPRSLSILLGEIYTRSFLYTLRGCLCSCPAAEIHINLLPDNVIQLAIKLINTVGRFDYRLRTAHRRFIRRCYCCSSTDNLTVYPPRKTDGDSIVTFYVIDVENYNNKNPCNVHCRGVEAVILLI